MTFRPNDWQGEWISFEQIIESNDPNLTQAWHEATQAMRGKPLFALMMLGGAQRFWNKACTTTSRENPTRIGGWRIETPNKQTPAETPGLRLTWLDEHGEPLRTLDYQLDHMLEHGLEGKPCYVFHATQQQPHNPFNVLIAMDPMPERAALADGGLLSHMHFQYASSEGKLIKGAGEGAKLKRRMWYPTMCAAEGGLLDQCNIVRALHQLPVWTALPHAE
ncbi:hypothetical protein KIH75_04020 [Bifidobacterium sp. 64T4]|uniref:hypothetical protein n=1 Tax=Bifidobacterium pongonis TaxID=2834432 RepID=UPI001C55BE72|nr:hypothetical protein [Bifidobacterium pongonis]MBW3094525.1 hypothetical protein [Bifidobacterium pongonis]